MGDLSVDEFNTFEEALAAFKQTHGHRSWWPALEACLNKLADEMNELHNRLDAMEEYDKYGE